jgi:hypothetical protein
MYDAGGRDFIKVHSFCFTICLGFIWRSTHSQALFPESLQISSLTPPIALLGTGTFSADGCCSLCTLHILFNLVN